MSRFKDDKTAQIAAGICPKGIGAVVVEAARRKIAMVMAAARLSDLKSPPGNKLHPLHGDREGQHAIWVNGQFRICFIWAETGTEEIEFADYH